VVLEAIVNRPFKISKDPFCCYEMGGGGGVHVLAELVH
jgi:hypothetical protein